MEKIPKISFVKTDRPELEFEIFTLSSLFSRRHKIAHPLEKPQRVDFHIILFITQGTGRHFIDFQPYDYKQGNILFISKGQVQAYDVETKSEGYMLLFTEEFLSKNLIHLDVPAFYRLYNYHLGRPILNPNQSQTKALNTIIRQIYTEYLSPDDLAKEEILRLLLKLLLLTAERVQRSTISQAKNVEWVTKFSLFQNLLDKHLAETRNAQDYAKMLNISYKHLNEVCKSITAVTAKTFIDNHLILEIKKLLATTDIPIKELTHKMGFDEPTNLVKFFKKHTQQSPVQFRKTLTH